MHPSPTAEQALHTLKILDEWTKRGWNYSVVAMPEAEHKVCVFYSDPEDSEKFQRSPGLDNFDALAHATTVMQILLEEHPVQGGVPIK